MTLFLGQEKIEFFARNNQRERESEREIKRERERPFYARFPVFKASTTLAFALSRN